MTLKHGWLVSFMLLGGCFRLGFGPGDATPSDASPGEVALDRSLQEQGTPLFDARPADVFLEAAPLDVAPPPDVAPPLDVAPSPDLAQQPLDVAPSPDLAPSPDVAPPPDLAPSPDLAQQPLDVAPSPDLAPQPDQSVVSVPGSWVSILSGSFNMGSPTNELCRFSDETLHQVILTRSFQISTTEVTQAQFTQVMGYNPSQVSCSTCPVTNVTWSQAASYCNALSALAKRGLCFTCSGSASGVSCITAPGYTQSQYAACPGYRLPTEAEWEYAYRAQTSTAVYNGGISGINCGKCSKGDLNVDKIGWDCTNSSGLQAVAQKTPNDWGLYDMAGNVWEWTHDWYELNLGSSMVTDPWGAVSGSDRVTRGGAFDRAPDRLRAAFRGTDGPTYQGSGLGFRCIRTL